MTKSLSSANWNLRAAHTVYARAQLAVPRLTRGTAREKSNNARECRMMETNKSLSPSRLLLFGPGFCFRFFPPVARVSRSPLYAPP